MESLSRPALTSDTPYVRDILAQARVLTPSIDRMAAACRKGALPSALERASYDRIVLTGMGSSYWALHPLFLRLIGSRQNAWLIETSELLSDAPALYQEGRPLIVAASQSGASGEIVHMLRARSDRCTIVGLTNEPEGPLAKEAAASLVSDVGPEATVSCKTYLACLAAQSLLGDLLLGAPPEASHLLAAAEAVAGYLEHWQTHVENMQSELKGIRQVYLAGRGGSLAAACTGGLIIKESTHVPAEGMSSGAFRHGPLEMIGAQTMLVVFSGTGAGESLNAGLFEDAIRLGGKAALVRQAAGPGAWNIAETAVNALPMLEILPIQMMTLALGHLQGRTPGEFSHSRKVTTRE